jgi:hypothetical protein
VSHLKGLSKVAGPPFLVLHPVLGQNLTEDRRPGTIIDVVSPTAILQPPFIG